MPDLDDFRTKLASDAAVAFKDYVMHFDEMSLDYADDGNGQLVPDEFKVIEIVFEFVPPNVIMMRAKREGDIGGREISYLPWKKADFGGSARASLDGSGPRYFSTSQIDGCRFTIQYGDESRKTCTVLHLAGDVSGGKKPEGSATRDGLEAQGLPNGADPLLRRRYSIGQMKPAKFKQLNTGTTQYYDGGKTAVFGYRNSSGAWVFYGAEEKFDSGSGLKNLVTKQAVTGPINNNANL